MRRRPSRPAQLVIDSATADRQFAVRQLSDSALPVGSFAHSFGLESALNSGYVSDELSVAAWLEEFIRRQLTTTDFLAIARAHQIAAGDEGAGGGVRSDFLAEFIDLDTTLTASLLAFEAREASRTMGARLLELATDCYPSPALAGYVGAVEAGECTGHYCLAYALTLTNLGIDLDEILSSYAMSVIVGLTTNAVRAVPLGQAAGQRIITHLHAVIAESIAHALTLPLDVLGASTPELEIAQMRHEHQHARLFLS